MTLDQAARLEALEAEVASLRRQVQVILAAIRALSSEPEDA